MGNKFNYSKLILPTKISNSTISEDDENPELFETVDYLFLPSVGELSNYLNQEHIYRDLAVTSWASDYYTLCNGEISAHRDEQIPYDRCCTELVTRSSTSNINGEFIYYINDFGTTDTTTIKLKPKEFSGFAVPASCTIDLEELFEQTKDNPELLKVQAYEPNTYSGRWYYTIELGEFPQTYVGKELNKELEEEYLQVKNIKRTGKKYCGYYDKETDTFDMNEEFEYKGQKYVRVVGRKLDVCSYFNKHNNRLEPRETFKTGDVCWCKVEPIKWKILNFDDMPIEWNEYGKWSVADGIKTKEMKIWCEDSLVPMPFHKLNDEPYNYLWQNSTPRGYFNGINVNYITSNGYPLYGANGGGDFTTGNNFLTQAFGIDPRVLRNEITIEEKEMHNNKKIKGSYGVTVVDSKEKPMPVAEQIEFYINSSIPFMLHGPSGVGKSRRIKDICPDFSSIKLARGMVPENAQGRDVFGFVNGKAESDWAPPAWYKDMCEKAEAKAPEKHILFIDEVTNVDLEQSYLYDIVLERQIAPGIGKFPDNVSVVLAGNEIKDSSVASALAEPLFRRQAHIYLEPNIPDWLEWGSRLKEDGTTNVHPLISDFVASQGMKVFYKEYDTDNPPKHVLDPRGWEQTSDIIYANNGELRLELLANKVGSSIAQNILAFAKQPVITVEDIVSGEIDTSAIPKAYDAKYSMAMRLRNATEEELSPVREFVKKYLGDEMLSVYDATWVGKDKDRAIFLNELKKQQSQEDVEEEVVEEPQVRYNLYDKKALNEGLSGLGRFVDVIDFWCSDKKKAIKCDSQWQADVLMYVFNKMGKTWSNDNLYEVGSSNWGDFKGTAYCNDGTYGPERSLKRNHQIYSFEDMIFSSVASVDEIVDALGKGEEFKIDVDKFWETETDLNIHCPEEWQAEILMKVFNRMGKKWRNKSPYAAEDSSWIINGVKSCYSNDGSFGQLEKIRGCIYPFEDVDLSKYLSDEEIKEIQDKMPETAYDNIIVM